jgi:hypothetical protein
MLFRQGDVLIESVGEIPEGIELIPYTERGVVLAEGEVTGHAHRIASRHASLYRSETDARYMRVMGPAPVELRHEEHTTVTIPPGNYKVTIHTEYQPGELPRQVAD